MELWHEPADGESARLASDVTVADTWLARTRGRMFTRRFPQGAALVFPFDEAKRRSLHMLAVPYAIDAIYLVNERVTKVTRLRPIVGVSWGRADTIVELPAGSAQGVTTGDTVEVRR